MNLERLLRDWRPWLMLIFIAASVFILFYPAMGGDGMTSLSFGLELDGGTYLQLDPQGKLVTTGDVADPGNVSSEISRELGVPVGVSALGQEASYQFEIRGKASDEELNQVFEARGIQVDSIENGLTQDSLSTLRNAVQTRLDDTLGVGAGATVSLRQNLITGDNSVVVEVPGERDREGRIADIIRTEGTFELRVVMEDGNESHVLYGDEVRRASVSAPRYNPNSDTYDVSFELTDTGAELFREAAIESGATQDREERLVMYFQDEEVFRGGIQPSLARDIESGSWQGGGLTVTGLNESRAEVVSLSLRSGELPAPVEIATSMTISPLEGERFKLFSLVIALISVLAVGLVIFNRYRDLRVAVPTMTIGLMEVLILLGFSAFFNFNIDLAFIAGLIAVIGTGVDDLIIIADEVQEHGKIRSADLYRKRLKRAFIVIGMAAVTTIGAMLPLAYFGLGRISSFAVVTIVGVMVGVLITRPAYGSILRELITEKG